MGKEQWIAFDEIKKRKSNPPVLYLPKSTGRLICILTQADNSWVVHLWQVQEGKPYLVGYASKTLPTACLGNSVTEIEMIGLLVNMGLWKTLLKRHEFIAAVDNVAVVYILKAKTEPATPRIMRLPY